MKHLFTTVVVGLVCLLFAVASWACKLPSS